MSLRLFGNAETDTTPDGWSITRWGWASLRALTRVPGTAILWAAGLEGTLLRSDDGGERWETVPSGTVHDLCTIDFADRLHGCAMGWRVAVSTEDGGRSWVATPLPVVVEAVRFGSPTLGIAVGSRGTILRSIDAGRSWQRARTVTRATLRDVWLHNERAAVAVGDGGHLLSSIDGGVKWARTTVGRADLWAVAFAGQGCGWIVGAEGTVLRTEDGGASWERRATGTTRLLFTALAVRSTREVWALGHGLGCAYSPVIRSEDGGRTWVRESSGVVDPIYDAVVVGAGICAVGRFGAVLHRHPGDSPPPQSKSL